jgi:hypothetical protein
MGRLLQLVGFGWALLGVLTCIPTMTQYQKTITSTGDSVSTAPNGAEATALGFQTMLSFLLFVVPGVFVGGVGSRMVSSRSRHENGRGRAPSTGEARYCSQCGTPLLSGAGFCSRCGEKCV